MDSIFLDVCSGPGGTLIRLNQRHVFGPRIIGSIGSIHRWCVSQARVEKLLQGASSPAVSFEVRQGPLGVDALLCDKTLAGHKKHKHAVRLWQCDIPLKAIRAALEGTPPLTLEVGAAYAAINGQKVVIFKRTQDDACQGIFVERRETGVWDAGGISQTGRPDSGWDLIARWDDARQEAAAFASTGSRE